MSQPTQPTIKLGKARVPRNRVILLGGVAGAGVVVWLYLHKKAAATAAAAGTTAVDTTTGSTGADTSYNNPNPDATGSGSVTTDPNLITTNAEWEQKVLGDFAANSFGYDITMAAETLGKYLAGQPLSQDEATLVRTAWGLEGHPPQDVPLYLTTANSTPGGGGGGSGGTGTGGTAKPAPPRRKVPVGIFHTPNPPWDSTLSGIAARSGRSVASLAAWNGIADPNLIHPGQVIWIDPPGTYTGSTVFTG